MDAFFTFFATQTISDDIEDEIPVNADGGGGTGNGLCTIA